MDELLKTLDEVVKSENYYRFVLDDYDEDLYSKIEIIKNHIRENRYFKYKDFWDDGCSYGNEFYIVMGPKNKKRFGSFWMSKVWTF